jgi:hypothetical protein
MYWMRWKKSPQTAAASRQPHESHSQQWENRAAYCDSKKKRVRRLYRLEGVQLRMRIRRRSRTRAIVLQLADSGGSRTTKRSNLPQP